jgi:hypothetical protein
VGRGGFGPALARPGVAPLRQNAHNNLFDHVAVTTVVHLDVYSLKNAGRNACSKKTFMSKSFVTGLSSPN